MSQTHTGNGEAKARQATMTAPDPQPEAFARFDARAPTAPPAQVTFSKRPLISLIVLLSRGDWLGRRRDSLVARCTPV